VTHPGDLQYNSIVTEPSGWIPLGPFVGRLTAPAAGRGREDSPGFMLRFVTIENFALIDRLEVEFRRGLNLITGETGSGKSILVDAVGLLVGGRASQEMVRQGFEAARVEGLFLLSDEEVPKGELEAAGIDPTERELVVRREISVSGNNRVFLNGRLATLSTLASLGSRLVDIHGQHSQQELLNPSSHLDFLDSFGGLGTTRADVGLAFRELAEIRRGMSDLRRSEKERLDRIDLIRYQKAEIEGLKLRPGIDRELDAERNLLATSERRIEAASEAYRNLYEDDPAAVSLLDRAGRRLDDLARMDPDRAALAERLREVRYAVEEAALLVRDYIGGIEYDPKRLEYLEERLAEIDRARRKYGGDVDEILRHCEEIQAELEGLENRELEIGRLETEEAALRKVYSDRSAELSRRRRRESERLAELVERELSDLAMEGTLFRVALETEPRLESERGGDRAEFLISPNPGEDPKPLARIASGGELSRIMLALNAVLQSDDRPRTLIFDEVDAGIGGGVARSLGEKLVRVAGRHQVFCVTHLPQIAAFADQHFHVGKTGRRGRTIVEIRPLDPEGRVEELARMLAGDRITETTRRQARELLESSRPGQAPASVI
jgi:DNA repair protein RecN (Recombination protein N)